MSQSLDPDAQVPPSELPPIQRHPRFFDDGVIFLIERQLYRIPRNLLLQSEFFRDMFNTPSTTSSGETEGGSEEKPICTDGVTTTEIESLLLVLNTSIASNPPPLSPEASWALLDISTKWGFEDARKYAISRLDGATIASLDRIEMGLKYAIHKWLVPAYTELCTRLDPLSMDEAERLGLVRYYIISRIREELKPEKAATESREGHCSSCTGDLVKCNSCGRYVEKFPWRCPIQVGPELKKHKDGLGLVDGAFHTKASRFNVNPHDLFEDFTM